MWRAYSSLLGSPASSWDPCHCPLPGHGGTCEGFVFKEGFRCAREMVWGMCRSLQFLEITTWGKVAFIFFSPTSLHCVLIIVFSPCSVPPTILHDVYVGQFLWGYVFFYPNEKESQESESRVNTHCLRNVSSGAGASRAGAACCADQYILTGSQQKHCILLADSTDKIPLRMFWVETNRDTYQLILASVLLLVR